MGGVYRTINLDTYRYCGNNPIQLVDPDGTTDNKTYITDTEGNRMTIAPVSIKSGPKVDITKIARKQQEQQKKTVEEQKKSQQQNTNMLLGTSLIMIAGSALVPIAVIGASEAVVAVTGAIDMTGTAVLSTPTGSALSIATVNMSNALGNELSNSMTKIMLYGPSFAVGAIQGYSPPSPVILENWQMFWGWIFGTAASEAINK